MTEINIFGEIWKDVVFDFVFTNDYHLAVSNYGRLRSSNKIFKNHFVKGSMINGYKIIRLKFYKARDEKVEKQLKEWQKKVFAEARSIKLAASSRTPEETAEAKQLFAVQKKKLSKKFQNDLNKRVIHYQSLIHRLVAAYFLPSPLPEQTIVAHLDFNKLNNNANNLKWMTPEENYLHQQKSPYVIEDKSKRKTRYHSSTKVSKLTITRVMLLKKMLNLNKPMKQLVKQFKITDTQILRIKRGENWASIEAAT